MTSDSGPPRDEASINVIEMPASVDESDSFRWRKVLTPIFAIIMLLALVGGSVYSALRPYLIEETASNFSVILTGISALNNCKNAPQVTSSSTLSPTRKLCICGRAITSEDATIRFNAYLRGEDNQVLKSNTYDVESSGQFCHSMSLDNQLAEGRYRIEITSTQNARPLAWLHFQIVEMNERAAVRNPHLRLQ